MADEAEIFLYQAIEQTPGAKRQSIVAALKAKEIPTTSTQAPWMVKLTDVQTWVADHP